MTEPLFPSLTRVIQRIRKNPQLFWTIFVAIVITGAFIFIAQMFVTIAQDAQDRVVNVRIGSIQDSLAEFVSLEDSSREKVSSAIKNLMIQNPTILDFTFYKKIDDTFVVFESSNINQIGKPLTDISLVAQLALNDTRNSYTTELQATSERQYQTYRSIVQDGEVKGLIETTQTLSEADRIITDNIQRGIIIFVFMLLLVMFLFFRHSRIIDYTSLYEELKKVDQLKDDFISMASHELKTPLATIRGYSEFISEGKDIPAEYKEYSRRIDISSKQLALLVEDMLDVSRIEQGRMQFKETKILIPEFIKKITDEMSPLSQEKNIPITVEQHGLRLSHIVADETRLRQVFVNLIGNAIKYTQEGSIKILVSNIHDQIEIRIRDTGIGMTEEDRVHLFEKFYRIQNTQTEQIKGTGLGLWITKELVEKMRGTLVIESIKGVGTDAILKFPAKS